MGWLNSSLLSSLLPCFFWNQAATVDYWVWFVFSFKLATEAHWVKLATKAYWVKLATDSYWVKLATEGYWV